MTGTTYLLGEKESKKKNSTYKKNLLFSSLCDRSHKENDGRKYNEQEVK
jgi:hypothetical protein